MKKDFKPTYLYIKTHNVTGLKYFGKTVNKDPYSYEGSGTRWQNHIKKHGYDVTTEILGFYEDEEECKLAAYTFSIENDIVKSPHWANLKLEVLDGGWDHITREHYKKGIETFRSRPIEEQQTANRKKARSGKLNGMYGRDRSGANNPRFGVTISEEQKQKHSLSMKGRVNGKTKDGQIINVMVDDERFNTGELIHLGIGKTQGRFSTGEIIYVDCDDPRFSTGELVHPNVGKHRTPAEKQHLSAIVSSYKWFNNGLVSVRKPQCPGDGWVPGRLKKQK